MMTTHPLVSVVMGVYNCANSLVPSLESILDQEGVDLEVIVVNDGSSDQTGARLDEMAKRDARIRVFHQQNQGLTRALARGCLEARGDFIARQDSGDLSLPGRLAAQVARACAPDHPVLVAVGCRCHAPAGELMYETVPPVDPVEACRVILQEGRALCHHGALLFRRDGYLAVGGYRPEFFYAQDLDLLLRLAATGPVAGLAQQAYRFDYSPHSISGSQHENQQRFLALARACQREREAGRSEVGLLAAAAEFTSRCRSSAHSPENPAAGFYFIASCLRKSLPGRARHYYRLAWIHQPLDPRPLLRYVQTLFRWNRA